jgi:hypothetical protein
LGIFIPFSDVIVPRRRLCRRVTKILGFSLFLGICSERTVCVLIPRGGGGGGGGNIPATLGIVTQIDPVPAFQYSHDG